MGNMPVFKFTMALVVAAAVPLAAADAALIAIPSLFNTGVDSTGAPLADGSLGDSHYTLGLLPGTVKTPQVTSVPGGSTMAVAVYRGGVSGKFPIGPWTGDDGISAWIAPDNSLDRTVNPAGNYYYSTTFDLSGFDPTTALIYGAWSADDVGAEIILNGVHRDVLTSLNLGPQNYSMQTSFNYYSAAGVVYNAPLQDGFLPGINTLTFRVDNVDGPTGFRVELTGLAQPIGEPASLVLLLTGLAGLISRTRKS